MEIFNPVIALLGPWRSSEEPSRNSLECLCPGKRVEALAFLYEVIVYLFHVRATGRGDNYFRRQKAVSPASHSDWYLQNVIFLNREASRGSSS